MKKLVCCSAKDIPQNIDADCGYIALCSSSGNRRRGVGHIAIELRKDVKKAGLAINTLTWDFIMIALSVAAADGSFIRRKSADGWTRQIEVDIHLSNPIPWITQKKQLEVVLHFLTGDYWYLNFRAGGETPPEIDENQITHYDVDCISLLSGGIDSLVGAIDTVSLGEKALFVSKIVNGDSEKQKKIASTLNASERHFQWSCAIREPYESEPSTRGRSIIFFAYAVLAASVINSSKGHPVKIYVPENGFISLNISLNPGRIGSFSTKTTHPVYVKGLESILKNVGINITFETPYKFKTKGEMLADCKNQNLLKILIGDTTSCSRFGTYKKTHCGRCLPCMVRRAAFLISGITDTTANSKAYSRAYVNSKLTDGRKDDGADDIGAVAGACLHINDVGIDRFVGGALTFAERNERDKYAGVVKRGLKELELLLKQDGVL